MCSISLPNVPRLCPTFLSGLLYVLSGCMNYYLLDPRYVPLLSYLRGDATHEEINPLSFASRCMQWYSMHKIEQAYFSSIYTNLMILFCLWVLKLPIDWSQQHIDPSRGFIRSELDTVASLYLLTTIRVRLGRHFWPSHIVRKEWWIQLHPAYQTCFSWATSDGSCIHLVNVMLWCYAMAQHGALNGPHCEAQIVIACCGRVVRQLSFLLSDRRVTATWRAARDIRSKSNKYWIRNEGGLVNQLQIKVREGKICYSCVTVIVSALR